MSKTMRRPWPLSAGTSGVPCASLDLAEADGVVGPVRAPPWPVDWLLSVARSSEDERGGRSGDGCAALVSTGMTPAPPSTATTVTSSEPAAATIRG